MSMDNEKRKVEFVLKLAPGFGIGIYYYKGIIASDVDRMVKINFLLWDILILGIPAGVD
ncbi:hypothetical protein [Oceanispirochaeta sp.]|jgi:hypothetical protein|uniref:hypothetical protein n=1 Tax=Oceanispirochaeta sp. TaxID=2035350 RepID=UPI002631F162|nr:hypothetical protein [Oceanispirochaeta sp.]MDA3956886.1 hypothetical protein [Oceanispirochaeta sp.]